MVHDIYISEQTFEDLTLFGTELAIRPTGKTKSHRPLERNIKKCSRGALEYLVYQEKMLEISLLVATTDILGLLFDYKADSDPSNKGSYE